jgi:hypothetical protein
MQSGVMYLVVSIFQNTIVASIAMPTGLHIDESMTLVSQSFFLLSVAHRTITGRAGPGLLVFVHDVAL